jgi:hypothetical protein
MATQWQTFPIEFRGGLISNLSKLQQGINAVGSATILQNFEPNTEGGYSKILGYQKYSTNALAGTGPTLALKVINSSKIIAARKNSSNKTEYFLNTGGSNAWTPFANNSGVAVGVGGKVRSATYNFSGYDNTIFVDGANYPAIYSTSGDTFTFLTAANSTAISGADHVAIYKNAAFYAVNNMLVYSAPETVDNFEVGLGGDKLVGQNITGLIVFRDQLIIFTKDTISALRGSSSADYTISPITTRTGCIDGNTIQEVGGDIMYLAPDGLRLLSATDRIGDFALDVASNKIQKDASTLLNITSNFCSVILREKAQYRLFSYIENETDSVAKGLITTKYVSQGAGGFSWATTQGIKATVADSRYVNNIETVAFSNEDGYVYVMDTGSTFDGDNIEAIYESPYMPITDPQTRKTFYKMTLYAQPAGAMSLDFNIKYDFDAKAEAGTVQPPTQQLVGTGTSVFVYGASNAIYGTARYGGELDNIYNTNVIGSGKTVALRIVDNTTNPTFTLDTAVIEYAQNDRQ